MPSQLHKVQKRISKKRTGKLGKSASLNALHENSRDAQRIRRAAARDDRVIRSEKEREKRNQRFLKRLAHLHAAVHLSTLPSRSQPTPDTMTDDTTSPFTIPAIHSLIASTIATHTRTIADHESARRPGRPKSRDHERAEAEKLAEEQEYESGFWMVDLRSAANVSKFERWDGKWEGLGNLEFVRVRRRREGEAWEGTVVGSKFPPTGGV
ncbi:putative translation machinery-associated protein 16 [Elsinoe fawcettii]|nr:putative translation machinery-associated protein 16 [Elsinoe fawcettii]